MPIEKRFHIALSFPGEHRNFVQRVAEALTDPLEPERIFYDQWYEAELARPNLDLYLQSIYRDQAELIVVFLCADYEKKQWCGLEWRAIRDLIKDKQDEAIMPIRFDETVIPGLFSIDGYINATDRNPEQIGKLILQRLFLNQQEHNPAIPQWVDSSEKNTDGATRDRPLTRTNPFGDRGCIRDPERFFGRQAFLDRIFGELYKGSSLSLVGESQVGKSSILAMIPHWGPEKLNLDSDQFIHIDMQVIRNEDEFFEALGDQLHLSESLRGFRLARALRDRRYIICLDEIEKMANRQYFTGEERSELRGLADGPDTPLTLVIASRSPLDILFNDDPTQTSPLSGLCGPPLRVEPFSLSTTLAFLRQRLHGHGIQFTPEQMQSLYDQTQGHPAKLQAAAADLYRQLVTP